MEYIRQLGIRPIFKVNYGYTLILINPVELIPFRDNIQGITTGLMALATDYGPEMALSDFGIEISAGQLGKNKVSAKCLLRHANNDARFYGYIGDRFRGPENELRLFFDLVEITIHSYRNLGFNITTFSTDKVHSENPETARNLYNLKENC